MSCGERKFVQMFQVTWQVMVINFKNIFLRNQEADDFETWYTASGTRVLTIFHMMTLGWPWLFLWQGQICFRMLGWKLIQHWMLMCFQVCSNSTYPQHSGERHRTNGPLVLSHSWKHVVVFFFVFFFFCFLFFVVVFFFFFFFLFFFLFFYFYYFVGIEIR